MPKSAKKFRRRISMLLVFCMLAAMLPFQTSVFAETPNRYFYENFEGSVNQWDGTAWTKEPDPVAGSVVGKLTSSNGAYPVSRAKSSLWTDFASTKTEYDVRFKAKYTDGSGAPKFFRTIFRYDTASSGNYYYLEFRQIDNLVYFGKYVGGTDLRIGGSVSVDSKLSGFSFADWHQYSVAVKGNRFQLSIDGTLIAETPADTTHAGGTIGFGVKNASLWVDEIEAVPHQEPDVPLEITHTPIASAYYNTEASGSFTVAETAGSPTASVYYRYGGEPAVNAVNAVPAGNTYGFTIPGTNRYSSVSYYIRVLQGDGKEIRYPQSGEITYPVKPVPHYFTSFEQDAAGSVPVDWSPRGIQPNIQVYDDNGNKVLRFFNTKDGDNWSAKFINPLYRNIDNFKVSFKAKYRNLNPNPNTVYNLWRLRYRSTDTDYNTMEWGTHNTKYIMFKRTPLGGFQNGSYYRSLPDEWHTYDLEVTGITHRLYIDGEKVIEFDDFSDDAPQKGYLLFNTINGLDLMIDDFEITPLSPDYTYYIKPSQDFTGIYKLGETPGLDVTIVGGTESKAYTVKAQVSKADGDKAVVAAAERLYDVAPFAKVTDTVYFEPALGTIGTYDVKVELSVDDVPAADRTRSMRIAVVKETAEHEGLDLDNESTFGFNVPYDPTWPEDMLRSVGKMGVRHARSAIGWSNIDKNNGSYNFSASDELVAKFGQYGMNLIPILGILSNSAYDPSGVVDTPAGLNALGRFAQDLVRHYKGKIRQWEMPNEPELELKPYIPQEVIQVQKTLYVNMKAADLDTALIAGDHTSGAAGILPGELELGSYNYADGFSYHRYTYGVMPDGFIQNQTNGIKQLVNELGGWKDLYLTESGWPTALSGYPSVSQEVQRDYAVRGFLIDKTTDQMAALEHFTWNDSGFDTNFYNTSFGVTDGAGRPKLAYAALNTLMTTLDQALYAGNIDMGDPSVEARVFINQDQPVIALWKKVDYGSTPVSEAPVSTVYLPVAVPGQPVIRIDVNGNESSVLPVNGSIPVVVGGSPVYLKGFGADMVYSSAQTLLNMKNSESHAKLLAMAPAGNAEAEAAAAELTRIHAALTVSLAEEDAAAKAQGIEQSVKDIYSLMGTVANRVEAGFVERAKAYVAMESLYNYAERAAMSLVYALQEQQPASVQLDYANALGEEGATGPDTARYAYESKKGEFGLMPVSTSAMMRANRYGRIAEAAADVSLYAKSYAYNLLAREFAGAIKDMVASESVISTKVTVSATPLYDEVEIGGSKSVAVTLLNRTSSEQKATLKWIMPEGWEGVQTEQQEKEITIGAGASALQSVTIRTPPSASKGIYYPTLQLFVDGQQTDLIKVKLTVKDAIGVRLMPSVQPVQDLETVTVRLTGLSAMPKTGKVILKGPDGVLLEPVTPGGDSFSVVPGQTLDLAFRWTYDQNHPFNEYVCSLDVLDTDGNRLIFHDDAYPLDFLIIQKAETPPVLDSGLDEWIDAFPIHLRGPERNATGIYDKEDLDATVYMKWDENHLYLAVNVQDDIHKAAEPPSGIWKNDSLQIAVDPLNDKGGTYKSDDVDFGLALNDFGSLLGFVFSASPPNSTGDISSVIPFQVKRNAEMLRTVYEVDIPGNSIVKALQNRLALGSTIGFNIVVADADFQDGRQNYTGWTKGIADSKNPGLYDSFTFVDAEFQLTDTEAPVWNSAVLSPSAIDETRLTLTWTGAEDNRGVAGYRIFRDGVPIAMVQPDVTSYTVEGLSPYTGYTFKVEAADAADNWTEDGPSLQTRTADLTPPATEVQLAGSLNNGWYTSQVAITLSASDNGTVTETVYSVSGGADWSVYSGPLTVAEEGVRSLSFRSRDAAGNLEEVRTAQVKLDLSGPVIAVPGQLVFRQSDPIDIAVEVSDAYSGVAAVKVTFNGTVTEGSQIYADPLSLPVGTYTIMAEATDQAGNSTVKTYEVAVTAPLDALSAIIQKGADNGWITNEGVLDSLLAKVRHAQEVQADSALLQNGLQALSNEIEAQSGKKIETAFAFLLLDDIRILTGGARN